MPLASFRRLENTRRVMLSTTSGLTQASRENGARSAKSKRSPIEARLEDPLNPAAVLGSPAGAPGWPSATPAYLPLLPCEDASVATVPEDSPSRQYPVGASAPTDAG